MAPQIAPDTCQTRVARHLQLGDVGFGIGLHRTKLEDGERATVAAQALLTVEHATVTSYHQDDHQEEVEGRQEEKAEAGK
jgi:hypothetical protein